VSLGPVSVPCHWALYFFRFLKFIEGSECSVSSVPNTEVIEDEVILRRGFTSEKVKDLRFTSLAPHLIFSRTESKMWMILLIPNFFPVFEWFGYVRRSSG